MKKEANSNILAVLNHSPSEVKSVLTEKGIKLRIVPSSTRLIPEDDTKHIYGFTSSDALALNLKRLRTTPILWETASVVHHISLNHPLAYLDAKRHPDGLIMFTALNTETLFEYLSKPFKFKYTFVLEKSQPVQYGNNSPLSLALNAFLATLPSFTVEPTLTALATALRFDYNIFNTYLPSNRLVTSQNKAIFSKLDALISQLQPTITALRKKDKTFLNKLKNADRANAQRLRFLLTYYGKRSLQDYLDEEENVNSVSER